MERVRGQRQALLEPPEVPEILVAVGQQIAGHRGREMQNGRVGNDQCEYKISEQSKEMRPEANARLLGSARLGAFRGCHCAIRHDAHILADVYRKEQAKPSYI